MMTRLTTKTAPSFGLLFDLDGTLVETDPLHELAWREVLDARGVELGTDGCLQRIRGRANSAIVASLLPGLDAAEALRVADDKEASFRQRARSLPPTPGVLELIRRARERGWGLAVVTNAPRQNAEHVLDMLGVREAFSVVVVPEDVVNPKPAPDAFVCALQRLGLSPDRALAFEDSPSGVRAAAAASLPVAGLLTGHSEDELRAAGAGIVAADFDALWPWIDAAAARS
jgi:HAD superfamily hydrolase (TIGR01509 family)